MGGRCRCGRRGERPGCGIFITLPLWGFIRRGRRFSDKWAGERVGSGLADRPGGQLWTSAHAVVCVGGEGGQTERTASQGSWSGRPGSDAGRALRPAVSKSVKNITGIIGLAEAEFRESAVSFDLACC